MLENLIRVNQKPIYLDYNGTSDDFTSLVLLLSLNKYNLTGITINNRNKPVNSTVETTLRILDLFGKSDIEIVESNFNQVNSFSTENDFVNESAKHIKILSNQKADFSKVSQDKAIDFNARKILNEKEKTTIILSSASTNIAKMLTKYPEIISKIEKILWVAGAFLVDGNVIAPDHDGSSEKNIFKDPKSAKKLLESGIPIFLFPLDICIQVPVDAYLMYHLEKNKRKILSKLILKLIEPNFTNFNKLYLNSILPIVYLDYPHIFQFESASVNIELKGTSLGNMYRTSVGNKVRFAKIVVEDEFYNYLIKQLKTF